VSAHFGKDAGLVWEELRTMLPPHEAAIYIQTCLKLEKPPTVRICDMWARRAKLRSMVREYGTPRARLTAFYGEEIGLRVHRLRDELTIHDVRTLFEQVLGRKISLRVIRHWEQTALAKSALREHGTPRERASETPEARLSAQANPALRGRAV
jgi:hypothetical protein